MSFFWIPVTLFIAYSPLSLRGEIAPYAASPDLRKTLSQHRLTAWTHHEEAESSSVPIPFLLYRPSLPKNSAPVPLLVFLPGKGETGPDLSLQFRQKALFSLVTSPDFQRRWPCYFIAPSPPADAETLMDGLPGGPSPLQRRLHDAVLEAAMAQAGPAVDTNRIYLAGLSYGGGGVYGLMTAYPGVFAAGVPVASFPPPPSFISDSSPLRVWHFSNEGDYRKRGIPLEVLTAFRTAVEARGGFRIGTYPDTGHDAWSKAWREPALWDWLFSKTADGRPVGARLSPLTGKPVKAQSATPSAASVSATASQPASDESHGPERAGDGLDGTWYASASPRRRGDWLQLEWSAPQSGRVTVATGTPDGKIRLSGAHVEISRNGRTWSRMAGFGRDTGLCRFTAREPFRFLRVVVDADAAAPLVIREAHIE